MCDVKRLVYNSECSSNGTKSILYNTSEQTDLKDGLNHRRANKHNQPANRQRNTSPIHQRARTRLLSNPHCKLLLEKIPIPHNHRLTILSRTQTPLHRLLQILQTEPHLQIGNRWVPHRHRHSTPRIHRRGLQSPRASYKDKSLETIQNLVLTPLTHIPRFRNQYRRCARIDDMDIFQRME